jgi:hypothetical protein
LVDKHPTTLKWATHNGENYIDRIDAKIYIKCSAAQKWRSTAIKQIKWKLYCDDEESRIFVAEFVIVGDSKTRAHVATAMVCASVFVVSVNI